MVVVGGDEGDGLAGAADAFDDGAEHVGELGADDQEPFGVGLGRGDLQQRHQLASAGEPVLDQAVVAELDEFLGADAGGAQDLHGRPGPEGAVFLGGEVAPVPGRRVIGQTLTVVLVVMDRARVVPAAVKGAAGLGIAGGVQPFLGVGVLLGGGADQGGQDREPFAGPGVHP